MRLKCRFQCGQNILTRYSETTAGSIHHTASAAECTPMLIKPVSLVKLLGVFIADNSGFNEHVSPLCVKTVRHTNALRRIVKL